MADTVQISGGTGFFGLLTLLLIGLKLTGYINWSWLWVLAPLWVGPAIFLLVVAGILIAAAACFLIGLLLAAIGK